MRKILLVAPLLLLGACSRSEMPPLHMEVQAQAAVPVPSFHQTIRDAMPFPKILPASLFTDPRQKRVYEIANRIPGVLAQQPCYCYCDKGHGHKGLLDCHKDSHSAG
jgi:Protein of unknown function with PCYCGC motif